MNNIFTAGRIEREKLTISSMIQIYCELNHKQKNLCEDCEQMLSYAFKKLDKCPFAPDKPTCIYCKVHCYQKEQREKIKEIMRFSGPKMIFRHPLLAIFHVIEKKREIMTLIEFKHLIL